MISNTVLYSCGQNEIHLDEIRKLRKTAQEQVLKVNALNRLLDERSERIRQLEAERFGGGAHAGPVGDAEAERLRARHQELLARVLELERALNEKVVVYYFKF